MKQKKAKIFSFAKGFYGRRKNCWTTSIRAVHKAWQYSYIGRKLKKREFRSTWIQQINAGARMHGYAYAKLIRGVNLANMSLDRKSLANLASTEPYTFKAVVEAARLAQVERQAQPQLR